MRNAFNITTDKPVLASHICPTQEDRYTCNECAAPAIFVNGNEKREAHFRHGPYLRAANWECSLLSKIAKHKNSRKNYNKIEELFKKGHIIQEQVWDYFKSLLKNRDSGINEVNAVNGMFVEEITELKRMRDYDTNKWETEINRLHSKLNKIPAAYSFDKRGGGYISATWLNVEEDAKVKQLIKIKHPICGYDEVYTKINFSQLERSCVRIMMRVVNPQTPEARISGQYIARFLSEQEEEVATEKEILTALTNSERREDRRQCVQEFLKILVDRAYHSLS